MSTPIRSGHGQTHEAGVNSDLELQIALTQTIEKAGFTAIAAEVDAGSLTASRYLLPPEVTNDYRLRVGVDTLQFQDLFNTAAINTGLWIQETAGSATIDVATQGWLSLNVSASSDDVAVITTRRCFPIYGTYTLYGEFLAKIPAAVTGNVDELGLGFATGISAPTDGAFFRVLANGEFRCVLSNGGSETTQLITSPTWLDGNTHHYIVAITEKNVHFWIDSVLVAEILRPDDGTGITSSWEVPLFFRSYNSSGITGTRTIQVSQCTASMADMKSGKPWQSIMSGFGGHSSQGQSGGTIGQTAQWADSADPTVGTPVNNSAALGSGLGGIFLANARAGGVTDYIISSYQVPAGSSTAPAKNLYLHSISIGAINTVAAVTTTPTTLLLGLAYGNTAASLATTEAAAAKAPRRIGLGTMFWEQNAEIGAAPRGGDVRFKFTSPICILPGEFVAVICRFVVGTATAGEVFEFNIGFEGFWE